MSAVCRRCGREGTSQFGSVLGEPGLVCSNTVACRKRQAKRHRTIPEPDSPASDEREATNE